MYTENKKHIKLMSRHAWYVEAQLLVAVVLLCGGAGIFLAHTSSASPVSTLPWSSGVASQDINTFAAYRHVPVDNTPTWPNRTNWNEISHPDIYGAVTAHSGVSLLTFGLAMLPEDGSGTFAACASGAYDSYFRTYGSELVRLNRGSSVVRLGWEANGNWYAWSIGSDVSNYIACFRKEARAIKATAPNVKIDWNMNKDSQMSTSVAAAYPGDDVVDIVGVDFYDQWPAYPNAAAWSADYNSTQNGGPRGIGAWLSFAKSHGKKLSLPEWGLQSDGGAGGGADHPYFIQSMFNFISNNASSIAYETYFNLQSPSFMIYPAGINPNSSALYAQLWGAAGNIPATPSPKPTTPTATPSSSNNSAKPVSSTTKDSTTTETPTKPVSATSPSNSTVSGTSAADTPKSADSIAPISKTANHPDIVSQASDKKVVNPANARTPRQLPYKPVAVVAGGTGLLGGLIVAAFAIRNLVLRRQIKNTYVVASSEPTIIRPQGSASDSLQKIDQNNT